MSKRWLRAGSTRVCAVLMVLGAGCAGAGETDNGDGGSGPNDDGAGAAGAGEVGGAGGHGASEPGPGGQGGGEGGEGGQGGQAPVGSCNYEVGELVGTSCGVFVFPGAAANGDGSQEAPFRTMSEAISQTNAKTYYVCTVGQPMDESVTVMPGTTMIGGIDCVTDGVWRYYDAPSHWFPKEGAIALVVEGPPDEPADPNEPTRIEGFSITSGAPTEEQRSTIAIVARNAHVELARVSIHMLDALDGVPGMAGSNAGPAFDGDPPTALPSCPMDGPSGGMSTCGANGGRGGGRMIVQVGGQPVCVYSNGSEGEVDQNNGGTSNVNACTFGGDGLDGVDGASGMSAQGLGTLGLDGYKGIDGTDGLPGTNGGGGGGSGSRNQPLGPMSGAGGGGGGCGATGGTGGKFGGSSIALLSIDASWVFEDLRVKVGKGGAGQAGGAGGLGSVGGHGGPNGYFTSCPGGDGGDGGNGGPGGAGNGGHSAVIGYVGDAPSTDDIVVEGVFIAGSGGPYASHGVSDMVVDFNHQ